MLKFISRNEWTCENAKINFDKVKVSTGVGEMDPRRGTYTCRQKGFLTSIFDNSYAYKYLNFNSIINDYWMFLIVSLMTFHIFF